MSKFVTFSPGPSQLYPTVSAHIARALDEGIPSLSHRSRAFSRIYEDTALALRELLPVPQGYHIWFLGSATEAMERIIQNTAVAHTHHVTAGAFAHKFAEISGQLGKHVTLTEAEWGSGHDLDELVVPEGAELLALTVNETSTGQALEASSIGRLRQRYPDLLIAVDLVSAAPFVELDLASVDCAFFSVQKLFGLPAGLGVLIASPRAAAKADELRSTGHVIGSFHSFPELAAAEAKFQTPETPNILDIYLLGCVARDLLAYGPSRLRHDLSRQANRLYSYFDEHPHYDLLVKDPRHRSKTVIVARPRAGSGPVIDGLAAKGVILGSGYAHQKDTHIRIANFPAHLEHAPALIDMLAQLSPPVP